MANIQNTILTQLAKSGTNYQLRGEGMANFVIGFIRDGQHMVWRIRKIDLQSIRKVEDQKISINVDETQATIITPADNLVQLSLRYITEFISPLFGNDMPKFLILPTHLRLASDQLLEIDGLSNILSLTKSEFKSESSSIFNILEMPDFAMSIPYSIPKSKSIDIDYPVISVEIKPKQGFIPDDLRLYAKNLFGSSSDFDGREISYCINCLSQYEKCYMNGDRNKIYDFCPIDLYSGDKNRMIKALRDLFRRPKTHLRILKNGQIIFDKNHSLTIDQINRFLFNGEHEIDFIDLLIRILSYSPNPNCASDSDLPKGCVLDKILRAQKLDRSGPLETGKLLEELKSTTDLIPDTNNPFLLFFNDFSLIDNDQRPKLEKVRRGLTCQTLRDCSIMITMRIFENIPPIEIDFETETFRPFRLFDRFWLHFNINIIDLDAKAPEKGIRCRRRLINSLNLLHTDDVNGIYHRIPCSLRK